MTQFAHVTVLLRETVEGVLPGPGKLFVDATLGGGGHSEALLEASGPDGRVIGIDRDPLALAAAGARLARFGERFRAVHGGFGELAELLAELEVTRVDGILADLGVSSPQLDTDERGFSFARSGPLDMRMDTTQGETLAEYLERVSTDELANVLYELGDERKSRPIARSIKAALELGELHTTEDLRRTVVRVLGPKRSGINPATRTFQALRMAVNAELDQLTALLAAAPALLVDGGRISIISFHSGEDRLVKHTFRDDARYRPLTKRPLEASPEEAANNPRARSAKLRVAERVSREEAP
jgi:16S rRNA (cytosine1402-N4)-methyltransferase